MKKLIRTCIVLLLLMGATFLSTKIESNIQPLRVLVLYHDDGQTYLDIYQHLSQTLVVNIVVETMPAQSAETIRWDRYAGIYLDPALAGTDPMAMLSPAITAYVQQGGILFVENDFYNTFPADFLGASEYVPLEQIPESMQFPETGADEKGLQEVIRQFHHDISAKYNPRDLSVVSPGYGWVPSTAQSLVSAQGVSLLSLNPYGQGYVLFSSKLLPNDQFVTGFDMQPKNDQQAFFNYTFASGNYLLRNEFLSFVSKHTYGYAVSKVLGTNGRPALAWQNHFEVATAMRDDAMSKWIDYLKEYDQIPSYSLVREAYDWGVWKEGVTVHVNGASNADPQYAGEGPRSQYSSGELVTIDEEWFTLAEYPDYKSLGDPIEQPYRAYIDVADLDNDGIPDLVAGTADGHIWLFPGVRDGAAWSVGPGTPLQLTTGEPLRTGQHAAPTLLDMDGDGFPDLIVGDESGDVRVYINKDNHFEPGTLLIQGAETQSTSAPAAGDLDGDGIPDLVIGYSDGRLLLHPGTLVGDQIHFAPVGITLTSAGEPILIDRFAAPRVIPADSERRGELLVGSNSGYIHRFTATDQQGVLVDQGQVMQDTYNPHGDHRLWGGRNSVPAVADVTGDGVDDLIVGQLIFGFAIPIDAPQFPYREQLQQSLEYAKSHYIEIQPHIFVHGYKSPVQELQEIELHKQAFAAYGLPWAPTGTNEHTWRINHLDPTQTFRSQLQHGIWWNSGFRPSNNPGEPSLSGEYIWTIPFLLADQLEREDFILFNPAPNIPAFEVAYPSYAKFDLPVTHFYHMEYPVLREQSKPDYDYKIQFLNRFRDEYEYNFMTEGQMFRSFMAAFQLQTQLQHQPVIQAFYRVQNRLRTKQQYAFTIRTKHLPEYHHLTGNYEHAVGYKVDMGEKYSGYVMNADSPIFMHIGTTLYLAADGDINVQLSPKVDTSPHIMRANGPVRVTSTGLGSGLGKQATIQFLEGGMQQIKFYAPFGLEVVSTGWKVVQDHDTFTLTKYGDRSDLTIIYLPPTS